MEIRQIRKIQEIDCLLQIRVQTSADWEGGGVGGGGLTEVGPFGIRKGLYVCVCMHACYVCMYVCQPPWGTRLLRPHVCSLSTCQPEALSTCSLQVLKNKIVAFVNIFKIYSKNRVCQFKVNTDPWC